MNELFWSVLLFIIYDVFTLNFIIATIGTFIDYGFTAWLLKAKTNRRLIATGIVTGVYNFYIAWVNDFRGAFYFLVLAAIWTFITIKKEGKKTKTEFFDYFPIDIKYTILKIIVAILLIVQITILLISLLYHI